MREGRGGRMRSGSGEGGKGGERRRGKIGQGEARRNVVAGVNGVCECVFVHVVRVCVHVLCLCVFIWCVSVWCVRVGTWLVQHERTQGT